MRCGQLAPDNENGNEHYAEGDDNRRRTRRGAGSLGVTTLALALLAAVVSCGGADHGTARATPPDSARESGEPLALPVVGDVVRRGDLVLTIRTTGRVRAERQVNLRVEAQGTVADIAVRPGQAVTAGQLLVRLDPRPFDLAVREAEGVLADARVRLGDFLLGDIPSDTGPVARTRRENVRLRSGIIGAEARYERARLEREQATITTPFGGIMDQVHVVVGQRVSPGDPIAAVVDLGSAYVEAAVLEHDLALIHPGASARVHVPGVSVPLAGRVATVLPLVDTTARAVRALVHVSAGAALLRPGTYGPDPIWWTSQ